MALGHLMASRYSQSLVVHLDEVASSHEDGDLSSQRRKSETASSSHGNVTASTTTSLAYLPQNKVLGAFEGCAPTGPLDNGLVSKWRPKDRVSSVSFAAPFFFFQSLMLMTLAPGVYNRLRLLLFALTTTGCRFDQMPSYPVINRITGFLLIFFFFKKKKIQYLVFSYIIFCPSMFYLNH
jgi:hypothetical protein